MYRRDHDNRQAPSKKEELSTTQKETWNKDIFEDDSSGCSGEEEASFAIDAELKKCGHVHSANDAEANLCIEPLPANGAPAASDRKLINPENFDSKKSGTEKGEENVDEKEENITSRI